MTHELLRWFEYKHLPKPLQEVSKPFADLAETVLRQADENHYLSSYASQLELSAGLRKLLEAKDCAVRAHIAATQG